MCQHPAYLAFQKALDDNPGDGLTRAIFADWLDENYGLPWCDWPEGAGACCRWMAANRKYPYKYIGIPDGLYGWWITDEDMIGKCSWAINNQVWQTAINRGKDHAFAPTRDAAERILWEHWHLRTGPANQETRTCKFPSTG